MEKETILEKIVKQRRIDVEDAKKKRSLEELKEDAKKSNELYPQIDFYERLKQTAPHMAVMAEVKRASPSKGFPFPFLTSLGIIAADIDAAQQGITYANAGAAAISCLTEPVRTISFSQSTD